MIVTPLCLQWQSSDSTLFLRLRRFPGFRGKHGFTAVACYD